MPRTHQIPRLPAFLASALFVFTQAAAQPAPTATGTTTSTTAPVSQDSAQAWVRFGIDSGVKGDINAAITSFNQALKIDPNFAPAYQNRGHAYTFQNKMDEAIADFSKAIELDPKNAEAYYERAVARGEKGDFQNSMADFSKAIELNPKFGSAYYNRGHVKYFLGDLDGAQTDLNQAVLLSPDAVVPYFIRGLVRRAKLDRDGAATDFQQGTVSGYPYAAFWLWIVKTESGDRGEAKTRLTEALGKSQTFKPGDWPSTIGAFLLDKISQDELLAKAKEDTTSRDNVSEAWFFAGMVKHFAGDNKGALDCFQQALATGAKVSEIYVEAQREVTALQNQ